MRFFEEFKLTASTQNDKRGKRLTPCFSNLQLFLGIHPVTVDFVDRAADNGADGIFGVRGIVKFTEQLDNHAEVAHDFSFIGSAQTEQLIKRRSLGPGFDGLRHVKMRGLGVGTDMKMRFRVMDFSVRLFRKPAGFFVPGF